MEPRTRARTTLASALTVVVSSVVALALVEGILRIAPLSRRPGPPPSDYGEAVRGGDLGPGGLLKEGFEGRLTDGLGGTILWKNNAAGFRSREETAAVPPAGVVRILSMGDSFVAGYRVDQEATYSRLVEVALRAAGLRAEVLIAEIEQPATGLWWLLHGGFDWRPSLVVLGVTLGNDVAQTGFSIDPPGEFTLEVGESGVTMSRRESPVPLSERPEYALRIPAEALAPGAPGKIVPVRRPLRILDLALGPLAQPIAAARGASSPHFLFDGVNGLGVFLKAPPPSVEAAFGRLERVLVATAAAARRNGADLLVVLLPQRFQVQPEDWAATARAYGLREAAFDLDGPNRRIAVFCAAGGIACLDLAGPLREARSHEGRSLYLPGGDMHWNARGHAAAAAALVPVVRGRLRANAP